MDRAFVDGESRLAHGFGKGRMGMADAGEILRRAAKFHEHASLGDLLACSRANDVNAEHPVGCRIGEDFYKALGVAHCPRPAIGGERKSSCLVSNTPGLKPF